MSVCIVIFFYPCRAVLLVLYGVMFVFLFLCVCFFAASRGFGAAPLGARSLFLDLLLFVICLFLFLFVCFWFLFFALLLTLFSLRFPPPPLFFDPDVFSRDVPPIPQVASVL